MLSALRNSKILFVIIGAFVLMALVFNSQYDIYHGFAELRRKALEQQQTGDSIKSLSSLLAAVADMESSARGFFLLGNEELLEGFVLGERTYYVAAEAAEQKLRGAEQSARLARARALESEWREQYIEPLIQRRRKATTAVEVAAAQGGVSVRGKRLTDEIRRVVRSMIDEESRAALTKTGELVALQESIRVQLFRLGVSTLLMVVLLTALVLRAFRSSEARTSELQAEVKTRRLAEQQALDGELRMEALIDSLAEGVAITDDQGKIVYSNQRLSQMWGYDEATLDGTSLFLLASIEKRPRLLALLTAARLPEQTQRRVTLETQGRRASGDVFPVEVSFSRYATDRGLFFAAVIRDISKRNKAEYDLRQAMSLQHAIFDSADYAIISTDSMGRVRTLNRAAEELVGARGGVENRWLSTLFVPEWTEKRAAKLAADLVVPPVEGQDLLTVPAALGETDEDEAELVSVDGKRHPVFTSITLLKDERERQIGFLVVAKDLTERLAVERMKSEFVAIVSHELRTPLAAIIGSLALIHEGDVGDVPEPLREFTDMAYENSMRLSHLIDDILDLSKIESGRVTQRPIEFVVDRFLHEVVTLNTGFAQKYAVSINLVEPIPQAILYVDRHRLMQAITNLLSNAVKFSPKGEVVVLTATTAAGWIRISIADRGPGIPEVFWPKIFGKFAQADGSDNRQQGGTGLGLAITKALVEAMGGNVGFVHKPPPGAEFYIALPLSYQARSPAVTGQLKKVE